MPAIADPYFAQYPSRNHDRARRVRVCVRTVLYRGELTRALAEGADPTESHEFARRAEQLTSARSRRSLARAMRRTLDEANRPPIARSRVVIIRRGAVVGAEDAIRSIIARLESPEPVRAQGMAMAERTLDERRLQSPLQPGRARST